MRQSLINFFKNTVVLKYTLPNQQLGIDKSIYTTIDNDYCYQVDNDDKLVELIVNSIVDYSFNDRELVNKDIIKKHFSAIRSRLRYENDDDIDTKEKYGFYGEVLLNLMLRLNFGTNSIIAKGYFYDILAPEENKGFDSFHIIETANQLQLWFGEVKFHQTYQSALESIFKNIEKAISDNYFSCNLLAMENKQNSLNVVGSKVSEILEVLSDDPNVVIADLLQTYSMKLVYPIFILCATPRNYNYTIKSIIDKIRDEYGNKNLSIGFEYDIFFILLPVNNVKQIKMNVIQWIDSKKPLTLL
ncbi:MAG: DUF1837 domain-containing protein [Paludibacteraceae bacterium]|nr:DUF1837 domain-containing protein [Paludibacteraceae bacterium]